jgi:hypothetical protein
MPFSTMPADSPAFKLWEKVHDASKKGGDDDATAAKKAYGAIKNAGFKLTDGKWIKENALIEFSMVITPGATMRWKMTASDTKKDLYDERMTLPLYKSFIDNINNKVPIPEAFKSLVTSDFWQGGMPYVSISHYPDLNGEAVPGIPEAVYTDGETLKAKGKFFDTKLGQNCYKSIAEDVNTPEDKKIRVSIAFLDLAHQHGNGPIFKRQSLGDSCPECEEGIGDKKYLDGYLVHFALTRVPINQRAKVEVEKSMARITRKQDAASIIDPALAEELEKKAMLVGKADVLVEFSDTEEDVLDVSESADQPEGFIEAKEIQDYPEIPLEEKADLDKARAAQKARAAKYGIAILGQGHVTKPGKWSSVPDSKWGDPVNYRYPMPDKAHAANAASRFGQEKGGYRGKGVVGKRIERGEKSAGVEAKQKEGDEVENKSVAGNTNSTVLGTGPQIRDDDPAHTQDFPPLQLNPKLWARGSALETLQSMFDNLNGLIDQIFQRPGLDSHAQGGAIKTVLDQLKSFVSVRSETLANPIDSLVNAVAAAKSMTGTDEEKLTSIQPALNALGEVIKAEVAPVKPMDTNEAVAQLSQKLDLALQKLDKYENDMTIMRAQIAQAPAARTIANPVVNVPKPRSLSPLQVKELAQKSQVQPEVKRSSLTDLVARRAGLDPALVK